MAQTGDKANWSDITTLFTNLNTARKKFNFKEVTPSGGDIGEVYKTTPLSTMKSFISDMKSNRFLKNIDITDLVIPDVGTLIKAAFINSWQGKITEIVNICPHDALNYSDFNSSSFDAGNVSNFNASGFNVNNFFGSGFNGSEFNSSGFNTSSFDAGNISGFFQSSFHESFHFSGHLDSEFNAAEYGGHIGSFHGGEFNASNFNGSSFNSSSHFSNNVSSFFGAVNFF